MKTVIEMAKEAGFTEGELAWHDEMLERFAELARADERKAAQAEHEAEHEADKVIIEYHEATIKRLEAELLRLEHSNEVLMNALWKACGDDEQVVNDTIESQGELK